MALHRARTPYPQSGPVAFTDLGLTEEQLAAYAVTTAQAAVSLGERLGVDSTEAIRERAAGDPHRVAEFVDAYRDSGSDNAVA